MGYKGKSDKEYQREYYLKNKYTMKREKCKNKTENMKEYQRQYYLRKKIQHHQSELNITLIK